MGNHHYRLHAPRWRTFESQISRSAQDQSSFSLICIYLARSTHFTYSILKRTYGHEKKEIVFHFSLSAAHNHCCSNVKSHFSLFTSSLRAHAEKKLWATSRAAICICIHKRRVKQWHILFLNMQCGLHFYMLIYTPYYFFIITLSCAHRLPVSVIPLQSDKISSLRCRPQPPQWRRKKQFPSMHVLNNFADNTICALSRAKSCRRIMCVHVLYIIKKQLVRLF